MLKPNLDYESPHQRADAEWLGPVACVIGAAATVLPLLRLYPMLTVASGTDIRPMEQVAWMVLGAGTGVAIVLPIAILSIGILLHKRRSIRWGIRALVAAILSVLLTPTVFVAILQLRGLTLAD